MTDANDAWEGLTEGTLSKEEEALLKALAEESEADAVRLEAYAPLGDGFVDRTVDKLAGQIQAEKQKKWRARLRSSAVVASGFAVAAVALLMAWPRRGELPEYTMNVQGALAEDRGTGPSEGPVHVLPESSLEVTLTPATQVQEALVLTVALVSDQHVAIARAPAERAPSGAFRLVGTMGELFEAPPGAYKLVAAVDHAALDASALRERLTSEPDTLDVRELVYEPAR